MPGSRKAQDLLRDPRLALHSATVARRWRTETPSYPAALSR